MLTAVPKSDSDLVRQYASEVYLSAARRKRSQTFAVNVGEVHKALHLNNRVPLVCAALSSKKFLTENGLRLVSKTGPPSGQSTTVTFTYEFRGSCQKQIGLPGSMETASRHRERYIFLLWAGEKLSFAKKGRTFTDLLRTILSKGILDEPRLLGHHAVRLLDRG